jgi:hypothetical protein
MTKRTTKNTTSPASIPVDEARQMHTWEQTMGRKPGEKPVTVTPLKAKLVHGIFANRIFGAEELALFTVMIEIFREETTFNGSGDMVQLELLCIYCLKITRALMAEQWDAVERLDRMIRLHMADLKLTRKMREGDQPADGVPNPLDYAMDLVERARQRLAERAQEDAAGDAGGEKTPETVQRTCDREAEGHA